MPYLIEVSICSVLFFLPFIYFFKGRTPVKNIQNEIDIEKTISFEEIIFAIYLLGFVINIFLIFKGLLTLKKLVRDAERKNEDGITQLYVSGNIPVSSFIKYIFIPSNRVKSISQYELKHERCHIDQGHSFDILFIEFAKSVLWFNPIVYLIKIELRAIHEYLADDHCIKLFGQVKYESFLIDQLIVSQQPSFVHTFNSLFKQRIQMMHSTRKISKWKYLFILPVVLIGIALFSLSSYTVIDYEKTGFTEGRDTIIPSEIRLTSFIDTVITFDPDTGKESALIIDRKITYSDQVNSSSIDTVTVFDPATGSETVHVIERENKKMVLDTITIVNSISGDQQTIIVPSNEEKGVNLILTSTEAIDTITTFDPITYKETQVSYNTVTGEIDTIYKDRGPNKVIIKN